MPLSDINVAITAQCFLGAFQNVFPQIELLQGSIIYSALSKYDLIIVPGGSDVSPSMYGEANLFSSCDPTRDRFESDVLEAAFSMGIPVYGSCRGAQLLAVQSGVKLIQDLHIQLGAGHKGQHPLSFYDHNSTMYRELRSIYTGGVNSLHHQGVSINSLPSSMIVAEHNGVVEISIGKCWLGTQFHPEIMSNATQFFTWLVEKWVPSVPKKNKKLTIDMSTLGIK